MAIVKRNNQAHAGLSSHKQTHIHLHTYTHLHRCVSCNSSEKKKVFLIVQLGKRACQGMLYFVENILQSWQLHTLTRYSIQVKSRLLLQLVGRKSGACFTNVWKTWEAVGRAVGLYDIMLCISCFISRWSKIYLFSCRTFLKVTSPEGEKKGANIFIFFKLQRFQKLP